MKSVNQSIVSLNNTISLVAFTQFNLLADMALSSKRTVGCMLKRKVHV